jgi:hypothetical protein
MLHKFQHWQPACERQQKHHQLAAITLKKSTRGKRIAFDVVQCPARRQVQIVPFVLRRWFCMAPPSASCLP